MTESIAKLRRLTESLPILGPSLVKDRHDGVIDYKCPEGSCIGHVLYNIPAVAVQRAELSAGSLFPTHTHDENEYIVIYEGVGVHILVDREEEMSVGDLFISHPREAHAFRALTDVKLVAVTVPASPGYPKDVARN